MAKGEAQDKHRCGVGEGKEITLKYVQLVVAGAFLAS